MPMHFIKYFVAMKNMKPMNTKKGVGAKKKEIAKNTRCNNETKNTKNWNLVIGNGQRPVDTCGM